MKYIFFAILLIANLADKQVYFYLKLLCSYIVNVSLMA